MPAQPMQKDLLRVIIAKDIARTAGIAAGTSPVTPGNLANGEVVVTDLGLNVLNTTTVLDVDQVLIVQGRGSTKPLLMVKIALDDIKTYKGKEFADKVEQVTYVGYNAVTNAGSFDVINDNYYQLKVYMNEQVPSARHGLYMPIMADFTSDATATEAEVANGLYKSLTTQLAFWKQKQILAELVSSGAGTATTDAAAVVSQSSTLVTTAPNVAAAVAVGDYIRIGSQSTDTDEIYKVVDFSTTDNTLTLDVPYQNVDATVAIFLCAAATINAADFGIRLTGLERTFEIDSRPYDQATFQVSLIECGDTPQATTTDPFIGHGTYEQIATMENASWGAVGQVFHYRQMIPYTRESDAVSTQDYSTLTITWSKVVGETTRTKMAGTIMIACALDNNVANTFDTNIDGAVTATVDVLDAWISNGLGLDPQQPNL